MLPKIKIVSDLHEEFMEVVGEKGKWGHLKIPVSTQDKNTILIIAGDLNVKGSSSGYSRAAESLIRFSKQFLHVVFVLGNHDYWYGSIDTSVNQIQKAVSEHSNISVLEKDFVIVEGVRIYGATMWTDMASNPMQELMLNANWSDLHRIRVSKKGYSKLRARDVTDIHMDSVARLKDMFKIPQDGPTIVVSHHAPCTDSIPFRFRNSRLNVCYVQDLTDILKAYDIPLWAHGHTHDSFNYEKHGTRIICNPFGYKDYELNEYFSYDNLYEFTKIEDTYKCQQHTLQEGRKNDTGNEQRNNE